MVPYCEFKLHLLTPPLLRAADPMPREVHWKPFSVEAAYHYCDALLCILFIRQFCLAYISFTSLGGFSDIERFWEISLLCQFVAYRAVDTAFHLLCRIFSIFFYFLLLFYSILKKKKVFVFLLRKTLPQVYIFHICDMLNDVLYFHFSTVITSSSLSRHFDFVSIWFITKRFRIFPLIAFL